MGRRLVLALLLLAWFFAIGCNSPSGPVESTKTAKEMRPRLPRVPGGGTK